ncbi:ATP-dependent Clp protease ATP-binding subunit [Solirubrobacter sp. CPCC 204708]|uniref:AAA family ATPase n=1 Tax=Solirubrobacter deserti TaxID=2282478 RepID=A0ABT4RUL2_9ACTN|nr:AAA family ATPase [Solirubrobacter deserti]MBE2318342.1 ATP-dependent Clp protease ATP-binding subunit [Solirubrobacter deserti]MDA0141940.1 AAA family ATPase [Solirubrobacter deserti]
MTALTSPHLTAVAAAVADGAHVVLRGHVGDEALLDGRVLDERHALREELRTGAGAELVLSADAADGLTPIDPRDRAEAERLLAAAPVARDALGASAAPRLGAASPLDIMRAIRALVAQRGRCCAILLEDCDLLFDASTDTGRRALGILRAAVREAECVARDGFVAPRNAVIVCAPAGVPFIEGMPGVRTVHASPPQRDERGAVLRLLGGGFHGAAALAGDERDAALQTLADGLPGRAVRDLEQARRASCHLATELGRPGALLSGLARRHAQGTPFEALALDDLGERLRRDVIGQPTAIDGLLERLADARWPDPQRPAGERLGPPRLVALMPGPPGVGKTETARTLQRALSGNADDLLRVDCSELRNPHDVARLTGAPPGFVGYEAGGAITDALAERPARVVLLDEIDKAHPDVLALLLAVIEEGRLTDGRNRTASFAHAAVLLTCNLGDGEIARLVARPEGPPDTAELLAETRAIAQRALCENPDLQRVGRPLWSRIAGDVLPYDILRRASLPGLAARQAHHIETNFADDHGVNVSIDHASLASALDAQLDADGRWDGREMVRLTRRLLVRPLRSALIHGARGPVRAGLAPDGTLRIEERS